MTDVHTSDLEIYARGPAEPDEVWALVGDPLRLPAWTDVTAVEGLAPGAPVAEGDRFTTVERGRRRDWRVVTRTERLLEVDTRLPWGALGLGIRVVGDPRAPRADPARTGTRVVLAAAFLPRSAAGRLRWFALGAPAVRRRFDRWSRGAVAGGVVREALGPVEGEAVGPVEGEAVGPVEGEGVGRSADAPRISPPDG